ncbi:hypothetical protein BH09ACT6_BH09ACT6_09940 [soil metagenome]
MQLRIFTEPLRAKRFGMLEEQLGIVTGLWSTPLGEKYTVESEITPHLV